MSNKGHTAKTPGDDSTLRNYQRKSFEAGNYSYRMKFTRTHFTTALKLLISCAFFSILFSFVHGSELLKNFAHIDWMYLSLSLFLIPIMLSVSCMKWKVILGRKANSISFLQLLRIYTVGYFFSNLLPSTVGGDVIRSYYSGKLLGNQSFAAVSIFVERFTGIFFLFFLVIFAPLFSPDLYRSPFIYLPAGAGFFLLCITVWLWKVKNPLAMPQKILSVIFRCLSRLTSLHSLSSLNNGVMFLERKCSAILTRFGQVREEFRFANDAFRKDRLYLFKIILLTALFYVMTWVNVFVAFRVFGIQPEFTDICALIPAILLAAHIPVTILGNLGYFESVFVVYFMLIGVPSADTLAMGLLLRARMLALGFVGLCMYLFYTHNKREEFENLTDFMEK